MSRKQRRLLVFAIACFISLMFQFDNAIIDAVANGLPGAVVFFQFINPVIEKRIL